MPFCERAGARDRTSRCDQSAPSAEWFGTGAWGQGAGEAVVAGEEVRAAPRSTGSPPADGPAGAGWPDVPAAGLSRRRVAAPRGSSAVRGTAGTSCVPGLARSTGSRSASRPGSPLQPSDGAPTPANGFHRCPSRPALWHTVPDYGGLPTAMALLSTVSTMLCTVGVPKAAYSARIGRRGPPKLWIT